MDLIDHGKISDYFFVTRSVQVNCPPGIIIIQKESSVFFHKIFTELPTFYINHVFLVTLVPILNSYLESNFEVLLGV